MTRQVNLKPKKNGILNMGRVEKGMIKNAKRKASIRKAVVLLISAS